MNNIFDSNISLELGIEDLAKYPFLEAAGEYVRRRGLSLDDISQPDFNEVIERAKSRVLQAIMRHEVSAEVGGGEISPEVELLSFPVALMLVKATDMNHLISRYSHAEALRVERLLKDEREELVVQIFRNVLKIDLSPVNVNYIFKHLDYKIPMMEYLKRSTKFHEPQWKLINKTVHQGYVYLNTKELVSLIRQEIDYIIRRRLTDLVLPRLPENIEKIVREISTFSPPLPKVHEQVIITPDRYSPCVTMALNMLQKGENLPHSARFLLTTYFVSMGKTVDDIVTLYLRSPDFNERITRYQVEHISGLRGGRVKYRCPSCRTMATHSFCFKTEECDDIKNPLQFGLRRRRRMNNIGELEGAAPQKESRSNVGDQFC
mgnify:FL=1